MGYLNTCCWVGSVTLTQSLFSIEASWAPVLVAKNGRSMFPDIRGSYNEAMCHKASITVKWNINLFVSTLAVNSLVPGIDFPACHHCS